MKQLLEPTPKEIRDLRLSIDLTQDQASNLLHVSSRHYRRWETGEAKMHLAFWELLSAKIKVLKSRKDSRPMA
jgi:DNA-binding transcriptional regulator YiaG